MDKQNKMETFEEFRRGWILDPTKEMIVEKDIISAYNRYKLIVSTNPVLKIIKTLFA